MKYFCSILLGLLLLGSNQSFDLFAEAAAPHCEVPCGIYEDSVRIILIYEHISTMEKAMKNIEEESAKANPNYNQLVRWINNKEKHAEELQTIVSQYFLHQRIKPADPDDDKASKKYHQKLELLHRMLVYSMKCKQTTDQAYIDKLRATVASFEESYFHKHDHDHPHKK